VWPKCHTNYIANPHERSLALRWWWWCHEWTRLFTHAHMLQSRILLNFSCALSTWFMSMDIYLNQHCSPSPALRWVKGCFASSQITSRFIYLTGKHHCRSLFFDIAQLKHVLPFDTLQHIIPQYRSFVARRAVGSVSSIRGWLN